MAIEIQKQKTSNLSTIIIIAIVIVIGIWLVSSLLKEHPVSLTIEDVFNTPEVTRGLEEVELNTGLVLNNPIFLSLTSHVVWPPELPQFGKSNPFLPF